MDKMQDSVLCFEAMKHQTDSKELEPIKANCVVTLHAPGLKSCKDYSQWLTRMYGMRLHVRKQLSTTILVAVVYTRHSKSKTKIVDINRRTK